MPRHNIGSQHEVSLVGGSLVLTNAANTQIYFPPGANGQYLTIAGGLPAWATSPAMTVAGDLGTNPSIVIGTDTLSILGGLGIDTTGNTGTDTITVALNATLDDLNNVVAPAPTVGQNLTFDGTNWINQDPLQFGEYQAVFNASLGVFPGGGGIVKGDWFNATVAGIVDGQSFGIGDLLIATTNSPSNVTYAGNWVKVSPIGSFSQFTVAADGGPAQTILNLNTLLISGGTNITTTMSASDIVTIDWSATISDLSDVNTAGAANGAMMYFDGTDWIDFPIGAANQILTVAGGIPTWAAAASQTLNVIASAGTNPAVVLGSENLSILAGTGITTTGSAGADSVTIALNAALNDLTDTTIAGPANTQLLSFNGAQWVNTTGCTWLANFSVDCLSDVDTTGVGVGDYLAWDGTNFVATTPGGGFTSWTLAGDAGANQVIGNANVVTVVGGSGIGTITSAVDTITINYDGNLNNNSDVLIAAPAVGQILVYNGVDWVNANAPATAFTVAASAGTNPSIVIGTDTLSILAGAGMTTTGNAGADSVTIAYAGALNNNSDVNIVAPLVNEILVFDGTDWVDTNGCSWLGNFSIDCLSDVVLAAPVNNQVLTYNGTNWVNATPAADFITAIIDTTTVDLTVGAGALSASVLFSAGAGNIVHDSTGNTGVGAFPRTQYFTPALNDNTVTLASTPRAGTPVHVYIHGLRAPITTEWSIAGTTVTFVTPFTASSGAAFAAQVSVDYWASNA